MNDRRQVANAGLRSAIIVDDGYDTVPLVDELRDEEGWDNFFDDVQAGHEDRIVAFYPDFDVGDRDRLKQEQGFVTALWENRDAVVDLLGDLFANYEQKAVDNAPFLQSAEAALSALGIPFTTHGRDFVAAAASADLILIDLFLGIQQGARDREVTVERLKEAIDMRDGPLPSIVLMSQIPTIDDLAKEFRNDVQLHASAFRYVRKNDLAVPGRVRGLILTLAAHRSDSQALATFVDTWEQKAIEAVGKAAASLRKIDIDDLQHIRTMLLRFEGVNTSSYMLDVFDRVLQYQIEAHDEVLAAAVPLDEMADDPPPLMISNDRDTFTILEQTLFVNPARRAHATGAVWPVTFGDIIGPRLGAPDKPRGFFGGRRDLVFFVASPECDLIRTDGLKTVLLVAGTLEEVDMAKPVLGVSGNTTPILNYDGVGRFQISWDFGNLRTIGLSRAKGLLRAGGDANIIGRLRDVTALGLRQQLLGNVGRVGEIAPLPRSFAFGAEIHFPQADGTAAQLALPDGVQVRGNMLVPRKARSANLVLDSNCENELTQAILDLDIAAVHQSSRARINKLKQQSQLRKLFRSGLQWTPLPLQGAREAELLKDGEPLPDEDDRKPKTEKIGKIVFDPDIAGQLGGDLRKAGLIFRINVEEVPA
ncbi:hypothetical protein [uncultured Maritimibacter sp.]|jgi:hypothetical protein|uniref:hypothetical protein n=1 Tax=Pseudooceanicola sp. MF1-13 TaxID=3379095 RepID=UPI001C958F10|nr:hypothetical protein [uncultured Maritimibacter sp.]MBY5974564.1 hypothetical protein [Ferrimonas balearica]